MTEQLGLRSRSLDPRYPFEVTGAFTGATGPHRVRCTLSNATTGVPICASADREIPDSVDPLASTPFRLELFAASSEPGQYVVRLFDRGAPAAAIRVLLRNQAAT